MTDPTVEQRIRCRLMLMELIEWIEWIIGYEVNVLTRLGIDYRRESLERWNNSKRWYLPAERMTCRWRRVPLAVAANNLQLWETKASPAVASKMRLHTDCMWVYWRLTFTCHGQRGGDS